MRTRMEFCKRMFCNILRYFWLHWNAGMLETGKVRSYLLWVFYPAICPDSTSNGSNLTFDAVFLISIFKGIFFQGGVQIPPTKMIYTTPHMLWYMSQWHIWHYFQLSEIDWILLKNSIWILLDSFHCKQIPGDIVGQMG